MRDLKKNQRTFYYALYAYDKPIGDDELDTQASYYAPAKFKASLSNGQSNSDDSPFGPSVDYDRIISTTDKSLPISETTLIWYGIEPKCNEDGSADASSANYRVTARPIDGLNSLLIPIKLIKKTVNCSMNNITDEDMDAIVDESYNPITYDESENTVNTGSTGNSNVNDEDDW